MSALGPRLLILSAPSGAGKTTLARRILSASPRARLSVSTTTREPRGEERDGKDYMFVNHARFRELIAADAFLEWEEVHGQLYGTGRGVLAGAPLDSWTIFDIDVKGGLALRERFPGAVTLFVLPPSLAVLEARLRGRRTESEAAIQARLAASWHEIERGIERYDYAIINSDLEQAVSDVVAVMRAEDLWLEAVRPLLRKTYVGSAFIAGMPPMQKDG